mmetsp:Transcript_37563/g.88857  ORF Transcript_37563/g.88857 Transcript_37563/m.88857 type:complete len:933 (-) Transcript_37563:1964-4762(-)
MEDLPEMSYAMRPSIMTFDAAIEGKDEAFAPPAEMPIKRLAFTPYKPASAPMTNPEPEIQQEQDGGMSSAMSSVMSSDVMSSEVRDSCASDDMEMEEAASEAPLKAHMPCAAPVESIKVFLRVRPLSAENEEGGTMTVVDSTTIAFQAPEKLTGSVHLGRDLDLAAKKAEVAEQDKYRFTRVFGPETQQKSLFDETARPLVGELFEGHSGLLFAYGPTNSGKTFTIQGEDSGENAGLLPRTLDLLFERIAEQSARPDADKPEWTVWITYMEIYNENIFDLLADIGVKDKTKAGPPVVCKLRETNGNIHVKGLKEIQVFTIEDAKRVAVFGAQHRKVAGTMMNEVSSRSHAVFNMKLCRNRVGEKSDPFDPAQFHAKLSIVDLAGSERATKTRATNERLKEAANINVSLMNLGRCLEELRWNQHNTGKMLHVVPFRHSKLTRLFQDHFMNGSKIYMIVAANPRKSDFDEALHALRYGAVARDIVVKKTMDTRKPAAKRPAAVKPVEEPVAEHWEEVQVDDLVAELECMRTQMYELQAKNSQLEDKVRDEVSEEMMKQMESMEQAFLVRLEDERIATEQKLERKLHILSKEISRREERVSDEEALQLQVQLKFYQTRVEEMQKEHKSTLARLLPGASPSAIERIEDESIGKEQMQQRLTGLEAQVASMKVDLDKKEEALQAKIKQKDDVNKVLGEADSVIRQLEQRFKCAEEQNDRLREELAQGHSDLALAVETSEQLSGKVAAFEQDTGALRSQETAQGHSDLHSDLALAIETSEELHAKLAASTAQHDGLVAQVMALEQDQSALRTQVSSLEGDKVALQSKVTGLEEHKTSQISGLVEEQGAQASLATALQARCEELTTSLAAAEASCADADSARATAEASLLSAAAATAAAAAAERATVRALRACSVAASEPWFLLHSPGVGALIIDDALI